MIIEEQVYHIVWGIMFSNYNIKEIRGQGTLSIIIEYILVVYEAIDFYMRLGVIMMPSISNLNTVKLWYVLTHTEGLPCSHVINYVHRPIYVKF